jgi:hypothetical protein
MPLTGIIGMDNAPQDATTVAKVTELYCFQNERKGF